MYTGIALQKTLKNLPTQSSTLSEWKIKLNLLLMDNPQNLLIWLFYLFGIPWHTFEYLLCSKEWWNKCIVFFRTTEPNRSPFPIETVCFRMHYLQFNWKQSRASNTQHHCLKILLKVLKCLFVIFLKRMRRSVFFRVLKIQ